MTGALTLPGRFRAAVCDVDGLLLDSEPGWARAEAALLARRAITFTDADRLATAGRSIDDTIATYANRIGTFDIAHLRDELLTLARIEYRSVKPRPGAKRLLHELHLRMPVAAASNTDRRLVNVGLSRTGLLPYLRLVITAEDVDRPKPAPDVYLRACQQLGVSPYDTIAFEDSPLGVTAAKAAGLFTVAVPISFELDVRHSDLVLMSLESIAIVD